MAQAPMGAPQGIRLSQLLALLGQQGQQQPPSPQAQQAPPPQKWRGVGMGGGMVDAPPQPQGPFDFSQILPNEQFRRPEHRESPPDGVTSGRTVNPKIGSVLKKTPMDIVNGIGNPVNLLPSDYFPSLHTDRKGGSTPQPLTSKSPKPTSPEDVVGPMPLVQQEAAPAEFESDQQPHDIIQKAAAEIGGSGVKNPEEADEYLRMEFQGDPEIEDALAQAKIRYAQARQRSSQNPGVLEYIGYALATLAGANPMQAAEAISRRGEKREDERLALQDLMGAQGMKIRNNQMNAQRADQMGMNYERLFAQQGKEQQRLSERGEDKNFERLKAGRGAALQRMNQLQQAYNYSQNPAEKKAIGVELEQLKRRAQFFGRQLGEPEVDENGKPIGQASPDAMRLLGLG